MSPATNFAVLLALLLLSTIADDVMKIRRRLDPSFTETYGKRCLALVTVAVVTTLVVEILNRISA